MSIKTPGDDGLEADSPPAPRNWDAEYKRLQSGEAAPETFTPAELFTMAQHFVLRGDWDARNTIYEQYIFPHPIASENDKARVHILRADNQRRSGQPNQIQQALASLEAMPAPTDPVAKAEWLEVQKQCHILLGNGDRAVALGQQTVALCQGGEIPLGKRIFYLAGSIADSLRFQDGVSDETETAMIQYNELLSDKSLQGSDRARAVQEYHHLRGTIGEKLGNLSVAKEGYKGKFENAEDPGIRAVAALLYLSVVWGEDRNDRSQTTMEMAGFLRQNDGLIQPAWRQYYEEKNEFVQGVLASL